MNITGKLTMNKSVFSQYVFLILFSVQILPIFLLATNYVVPNKYAAEYESKLDVCVEKRMKTLIEKGYAEKTKIKHNSLSQSQEEEIKADSAFYCENKYSYLLFKSNKLKQNLVFKCLIIAVVSSFVSLKILAVRGRVKSRNSIKQLLVIISLFVVVIGVIMNVWMVLF